MSTTKRALNWLRWRPTCILSKLPEALSCKPKDITQNSLYPTFAPGAHRQLVLNNEHPSPVSSFQQMRPAASAEIPCKPTCIADERHRGKLATTVRTVVSIVVRPVPSSPRETLLPLCAVRQVRCFRKAPAIRVDFVHTPLSREQLYISE